MSIYKGLPGYYRKSKLTDAAHTAIQNALSDFEQKTDRKMLDLFITDAENFALHEKDAGLPCDVNLNNDTRRARVIARLRGNGVLTVEALKKLIELYEPDGADIIELYGDYAVILKFPTRTDSPKNIYELMAAIDEVIPAHISPIYQMAISPASGTVYFGSGLYIRRRLKIDARFLNYLPASYKDLTGATYGKLKNKIYARVRLKEG